MDTQVDRRGEPDDAAIRRRPRTVLWVALALLGAVVLIGAVVGALREPAALEPGTPEAAVQAYLQAVLAGDAADALEHLDAAATRRCDAADLRTAWVPDSLRATLDEVTVDGDTAEVVVRLRSIAGPEPFGGSGVLMTEVFTLRREEGAWRISEPFWPVWRCAG
jgi:hypothetical protein